MPKCIQPYDLLQQHLLNGKHLYTEILTVRGPLFIMFYALILKIFDFTAYSIIAVHLFHTLMIVFTCVVIYLITKLILENSFYAGLAVCFWVLFQITPIGLWGQRLELEATFALEAEYFCILLSMCSMLCMLLAFKATLSKKNPWVLSFCAGILATLPVMFKASGPILALAVVCWLIYLLFFEQKAFYIQKKNFGFFCIGLFLSLLVFIIAIYIYNGELFSFWQNYFMFGNYSKVPLSVELLFSRTIKFMYRYTPSLSNFIIFLVAFSCFVWGLIRNHLLKKTEKSLGLFSSLISIWGIGSICAVIAPGDYGSYYYILVWPAVAIVMALGLHDLFGNMQMFKISLIKVAVIVLILMFSFQRLYTVFPTYRLMAEGMLNANFLRQPQSFQDPVLPYDTALTTRTAVLKIGDIVNSYLPDKNDSVYIFAFPKGHQSDKNDSVYIFAFPKGHQFFGPPIYIYAKRPPAIAVTSDWLHYEQFLGTSLSILKRQLDKNLPKVIILPKDSHLKKWQINSLIPFFKELNYIIQQKYHLVDTFEIYLGLKERDAYQVFERN